MSSAAMPLSAVVERQFAAAATFARCGCASMNSYRTRTAHMMCSEAVTTSIVVVLSALVGALIHWSILSNGHA